MIEIKNVCKAYTAKPVLNNININIETGTIHGIIGENGSGKTTLIKCVTGIYRPNRGSILIDGEQVFDNPSAKEKIGYVADSNQYFLWYSVEDMVKLYEAGYKKFDRKKFNELNMIFNVPRGAKIKHLSKGQSMRVTFMLNMAYNPDYLILDEPTSGLDPVAKKELFDIVIDEVEKRNMTVFISSHHLADLEKICDKITVIKNGRVILHNDIEGIKENISKLQVVIENKEVNLKDIPNIIEYTSVGSIYTIVVRDYNEKTDEQLKNLGASFIEQIDISLEETFIYANIGGAEKRRS